MIDPAIISLLIAALGVIVSIYVAGRKAKTEDISRAVEEAKHGTEVNVKLDMIMKSTDATAKKLDRLQEDMADMKKQNSAVPITNGRKQNEEDQKAAHDCNRRRYLFYDCRLQQQTIGRRPD